ncbi:SRPBCC domain-containing protein [Paraflavitalea soli]|uniref:SRPBCC domain-containing protein n=1 Tax=Paraflavitalea soli TaxID=2315862 RepID=A0A3B7MVP7_9BACT|nr:SRPBCC domain-containing protein [Paraflavitalea soli]AXY78017.1 SRPBCC domain-containing protein [Paraflavitalea soli]
MTPDLISTANTLINATPAQVWQALVDPAAIKQFMFGATVRSEWKKGSRITWKGEWKGTQYEDKGEILDIQPPHRLQYSHYSPLTGQEDKPENYHTVTIDLLAKGDRTSVSLSQDNNRSEESRQESDKNWAAMLQSLKKVVEDNIPPTI